MMTYSQFFVTLFLAILTLASALRSMPAAVRPTLASALISIFFDLLKIFIEIMALNSPPSRNPEMKPIDEEREYQDRYSIRRNLQSPNTLLNVFLSGCVSTFRIGEYRR